MPNQETKEAAHTAAKAATEASWSHTRIVLRIIVIILIVAVTLWIILKLTGVILLLILSIFFAYFVYPLVEFLRRPIKLGKRTFVMPRVAAIAVAYTIIIGVIVLGIYLLAPRLASQFPEFTEQARGYWTSIGAKMQNLVEYFRTHRMPGPLLDAVNKTIPTVVESVSHSVSEVLRGMVGWLGYIPWLVLIPVLSFFMLKDADTFRASALHMLPKGRWRWRGDEFFQDINSTLAAYIRAQLTACVFIGVVCAVGFTLLGLPSPLVLGVLAGVFEFVPLVGPLVIAVIAAVLAVLHSGTFSAFMVLLFLAVLRIVQDYVVYPRLIGHGIHLHPLAVIIAILAGAELAGVAGIFLAIPVVAIMTVSYKHWLEHRGSEGIADLLESNANDTVEEETLREPFPDLTTGELKLPSED
ncbi:MAG TPA: AI-2E family transporter [Pyrinomonadaceae bacterium]|nr:AI-2E family transporter [Pyrinomonadaceae bacterium]